MAFKCWNMLNRSWIDVDRETVCPPQSSQHPPTKSNGWWSNCWSLLPWPLCLCLCASGNQRRLQQKQRQKAIERLSYDLKKVFAICFTEPMFGNITTKLLLIPAKETPNMGSKQFDCPIILLYFKWRQSEMPFAFQKVPWRDDVVCTCVR